MSQTNGTHEVIQNSKGWPLIEEITAPKMVELCTALFGTGSIERERVSRIAGSWANAQKYVSMLRAKLAPGYDIVRSGTGYAVSEPGDVLQPDQIHAKNVPIRVAMDVVAVYLQQLADNDEAEIKELEARILALTAQKQEVIRHRESLELGIVAIYESSAKGEDNDNEN